MDNRERRIRDEAYLIWVDAGRPEGHGQDHWLEAEKRVARTEKAKRSPPGAPATKRGVSAPVVPKNAGNGAVAAPVRKPKAAPAKSAPLKGNPVDVAPAGASKPPRAPNGRPKS